MNYHQIRAFHAVAKEGGVSRAARILGVSQPTLSEQIKDLEARRQVRLFQRQGRRLRLTPAGEELLALTHRLTAMAEEIDDLLSGAGATEIGGHLDIVADGPRHAAALLAAFRARHPGPRVSLAVANAQAGLAQLADGRADAAIIADPPAASGLHFQPIGLDPLTAVVPAGHRLAAAAAVPVAALAEETLLLREPGSRTRALTLALLEDCRVQPAETIQIATREAVREAVAHGLGLSLIIESEAGDDRRVAIRPLASAPPRCGSVEYVVCSEERRRRPILRAFLEIARDYARAWETRRGA